MKDDVQKQAALDKAAADYIEEQLNERGLTRLHQPTGGKLVTVCTLMLGTPIQVRAVPMR